VKAEGSAINRRAREMKALLLLRPGKLRDGINALLCAMPEIGLVAQTEDSEEALNYLAVQCAELVLTKVDPRDDGLQATIREMKTLCPDSRIVALVGDDRDQLGGAPGEPDLVLREGLRASEVRAQIKELVRSLEEQDKVSSSKRETG
jgi:hypothetical protein